VRTFARDGNLYTWRPPVEQMSNRPETLTEWEIRSVEVGGARRGSVIVALIVADSRAAAAL
jgi:hypothetical protein